MMKEQKLKMNPYGVSDFDLFRKENYYFVDKTGFIRDIENKGRYLFLIRPRRFGKSLFLGILEDYYDVARKEEFNGIFESTVIHSNPTAEHSSYLILKFNFSRVSPGKSGVEEAFLTNVKNTVNLFITKYEKYLELDIKEVIIEINSKSSSPEVLDTFLRYCSMKEQKLYVIIDEYDNFANTILSHSGEQAFQDITHGEGFLRAFFNVIKAGTTGSGAPISRLFVSGVSPITLDDVTSGFNIATNISLDSDINEIMGFTKKEVETMIDYYRQGGEFKHSTGELLEIMEYWYDHYRFSMDANSEVFNSVHVLYFLREYMKDFKIPALLIDENVRMDYQKLRYLIIIDKKGTRMVNGNFSQLREIIETGNVHTRITRSFPVRKLIETDNFASLLYYFGLLTIIGRDEENKAILGIPNESIKRLYYDYIKETYEETGILKISLKTYETLMKGMAFHGEWKPLMEYLGEQMDSSTGIRDLIGGEKSIQAFFNVYLGLSELYLIWSEKELNKGYADLVLEPFLAQYPALKYSYIIEIKYLKPSEYKKSKKGVELLNGLKEEGENQLDKYSKDKRFEIMNGQVTLKKLILIFAGTKLVYLGEI